jgi:flagellar hook-associated protein 2
MGSFNLAGLGGGMDVQAIVQQLMYLEREPVRRLEERKNDFQHKIDAYNKLESNLSSLLSNLDALNDPESFSARAATSSNDSVLTANATSSSAPGTYQIQVSRLALFDNHASDSTFSSSSAAIGTGSFDLRVGDQVTTIEIDASENTLEGLKNEINRADAGATAAIINDGSGYRLTITSQESGAANAITIENNSLTLSDGSTPFAFSRTHTIADEAELDASLTVNGLSVTSSSNQVSGVIEGVTVNILSTSETTTTLIISNDTDRVKEAIQEFVDAYNETYSFINSQFEYYESVESSGDLAGEALVRSIQSDLGRIVSRSLEGTSGSLSTLSSVGVQLNNDGTLELDSSTLDQVLADNFNDVKELFVAVGTASHAAINYLGSSANTSAGTYEIEITQLAEAAQVVSSNAISTTLGVDETLTITSDSVTSIVSLTSLMTIDDVVEALNDQFDADELSLSASKDGSDHLVITSNQVGSSVSFTVVSDTDVGGTGFGTSGQSDTGVDVAGTLTDEATATVYSASGSGNVLVGSEGPVQDLRLEFDGTSIGSYGTISFTTGYADQLSRLLEGYTDSLEGPITGTLDRLESSIRTIDKDIQNWEDRLVLREAALTKQFSLANQALQELSFLQSSLSSQLNQLNSLL